MDIDTRYNINDGELYVHMIQIFELVPGKDYEAEWIIWKPVLVIDKFVLLL